MQDRSVGVILCVRRRFGDNAILLGAPIQLGAPNQLPTQPPGELATRI